MPDLEELEAIIANANQRDATSNTNTNENDGDDDDKPQTPQYGSILNLLERNHQRDPDDGHSQPVSPRSKALPTPPGESDARPDSMMVRAEQSELMPPAATERKRVIHAVQCAECKELTGAPCYTVDDANVCEACAMN